MNHVEKYTHNGEPLALSVILSLESSDEFTSTLTEAGKSEVGKRIKEFEIYHEDYGWIRCYAAIQN